MKAEAKIITSIFLFYLIFGLNNLGVNGRFIAPHLLDSVLLIGLSVYFFVKNYSDKSGVILFSITGLYGIIGLLIDPQVFILADGFIDTKGLSDFLRSKEEVITLLLLIISFIYYGLFTVWTIVKSAELKGNRKLLILTLGIGTALLFILSLVFKADLLFLNCFVFLLSGFSLTKNSSEEYLQGAEYPYLLLNFMVALLALFEFISLAGLITS